MRPVADRTADAVPNLVAAGARASAGNPPENATIEPAPEGTEQANGDRETVLTINLPIELRVTSVPPAYPSEIGGLNFDVILLYSSRGRKPERRLVMVHGVEIGRDGLGRPGVSVIEGYCHLRRAPRTFVVAKILEMADGATGEIISDPRAWLMDRAMDHRPPPAPPGGLASATIGA